MSDRNIIVQTITTLAFTQISSFSPPTLDVSRGSLHCSYPFQNNKMRNLMPHHSIHISLCPPRQTPPSNLFYGTALHSPPCLPISFRIPPPPSTSLHLPLPPRQPPPSTSVQHRLPLATSLQLRPAPSITLRFPPSRSLRRPPPHSLQPPHLPSTSLHLPPQLATSLHLLPQKRTDVLANFLPHRHTCIKGHISHCSQVHSRSLAWRKQCTMLDHRQAVCYKRTVEYG